MSTEQNTTIQWRWQIDPLSDSDRVQVASEDGVVLAEVASIKSANYITHRLNNHDGLMEALENLISDIDRSQFRLAQDCLSLGAAREAIESARNQK